MAYELRDQKGIQIKREGHPVLASDTLEVKIEQHDEKNKSFIAVASDESEDRDKDIIRQAGWNLKNFKKSPIVPWSHNYWGVPVAKSLKTWIDNSGKTPRLLFQPKFDENDDDSMKIYNKYVNGFLTSFSVGFRGLEFTFRDEENRWSGGREFTKQELLEISCVAVPANPNASTRLNYTGGDAPENLIQLGYPEVFAKTDNGLFYPIRDIAIFSQPKEFEVEKGVVCIKAVSLDEEIKDQFPVAYMFDKEVFDEKTANEWVRTNIDDKQTVKYFDMKIDEEKGFVLDSVIEEHDIKYFDSAVDLTKQNEEVIIEIEEEAEVNPIKQSITVITIIKDHENEVVDQSTEQFAVSNKAFKTVDEYNEWKTDKIVTNFKTEIIDFKKDLIDYFEEKVLAKLVKKDNNESILEDIDNDDSNKDIIELDESIISPDDDNTDLDDEIEIDENTLSASSEEVKDAFNKAIVETLKQNLREALRDVSGKID